MPTDQRKDREVYEIPDGFLEDGDCSTTDEMSYPAGNADAIRFKTTLTIGSKKVAQVPFGAATNVLGNLLAYDDEPSPLIDGITGWEPAAAQEFMRLIDDVVVKDKQMFLFDGRDNKISFGDFSNSGTTWIDDLVHVSGERDTWSAKSEQTNSGRTVFDTGTNVITVSSDRVESYYRALRQYHGSGVLTRASTGGFVINCDTDLSDSPGFEIVFGKTDSNEGVHFDLPAGSLRGGRVPVSGRTRWCFSLLQPGDWENEHFDTVLGSPWFEEYATIFDAAKRRIGIRKY